LRSKNKKKKSAFRRGDKTIIFLRRGIIFISLAVLIMILTLGAKYMTRSFIVRDIVVSGNYHLEEEDIVRRLNMGEATSLLSLSYKDVDEPLRHSPWVKKVSIKRQLPDTLMIRIEEAVPKALLSLNGHTYLIEGKGGILEEIGSEGTQFLPVIRDIEPDKDRKGLLEALQLIDALSERNVMSSIESVEISLRSYGLDMNIDGEMIKVGYGKYHEKLDRWKDFESRMNEVGAAKYIDLRFQNKVIVKPLKLVRKKVNSRG
jgi:cell division protein FtsQ